MPAPIGYHDGDAFDAARRAHVAEAGDRAGTEVLGHTVEGRAITAVRVAGPGRRPADDRPQALVLGGIHGCEVIATELALDLLGALCRCEPGSSAAAVLEVADVTVVPALNLDGRARALASLDGRRLFNGAPRRNVHGVDLNRNWPFPRGVRDHWSPLAGTGIRWLPWYRGTAPLSEPESRALASLAERRPPFALLNLHSTGEIVTWPWSSKEEASPDEPGFMAMADAFRAAQPHARYRAKQSRAWYPIVGNSNDWFHDTFGTLAITVEVSPSAAEPRRDPRRARWFFWYANPVDRDHHVANTLEPCLAALETAAGYRGLTGATR